MKYEEWLKRKKLSYKDENLFFDGVDLIDLTNEYGTPLYVTSEDIVREQYNKLINLLKSEYEKSYIYFAVKSNSNISILKILDSEGSYFDCSSVGEIKACFRAGINSSKILYTGNMFTNEDFQFAIENDIKINLDSLTQLKRLNSIYERLNRQKKLISFRFNPEFGAGHHSHTITAGKEIKFGILEHQIIDAYSKAKNLGFSQFGIHQHIGSGILDARDYEKAVKKFIEIIKKVVNKVHIKFEFIDFGGGLGIPYRPNEDPLDLKSYRQTLMSEFKDFMENTNQNNIKIYIEPGRFITGESTILLAEVNTLKDNGYKLFAGINAGFNTLIRPTLYGSYHHIINCQKHSETYYRYDVAGPICESGDVLGKDRELNEIKLNDILAILDTGAYGFSMASNYNSRPRPAEVILHNNEAYLMRKSESYEDLFALQTLPEFLKD
ncbi:MAG: diaminopimelate decarboxylase [Promethearchaeota archaeon]|nr:MAG: diaminopimelate decarboxylase [Candidatus Lokiarchaeota archaeon]